MTLNQFINIVNQTLNEKGYPIDIRDMPDVEFSDYFEPDFTIDEAKDGAEELVDLLIYDGELPTL